MNECLTRTQEGMPEIGGITCKEFEFFLETNFAPPLTPEEKGWIVQSWPAQEMSGEGERVYYSGLSPVSNNCASSNSTQQSHLSDCLWERLPRPLREEVAPTGKTSQECLKPVDLPTNARMPLQEKIVNVPSKQSLVAGAFELQMVHSNFCAKADNAAWSRKVSESQGLCSGLRTLIFPSSLLLHRSRGWCE
jgi:hypothetical protein